MNRTLSLFLVLAMAGCTTAAPTLQTGPGAETTFDGLVRVDNSRFEAAWADPDIDFSQYTKVMPGGAEFEFRAVSKTSSMMARRGSGNEFWISDANKQKLIDTVSEVFNEEIGKASGWEVVDAPGPDVLMLRGAVLDVVSNVPPEMIGRSEIYLTSVGEATLVIEGVDSMSGEVLFRATEHSVVERPGGTMMYANTVTTWAEVRRWARRYATWLREGLESIRKEG